MGELIAVRSAKPALRGVPAIHLGNGTQPAEKCSGDPGRANVLERAVDESFHAGVSLEVRINVLSSSLQ